VDVRLIAATNQNLSDLMAQHQFREDLFYRINVFPIQVPSLRERSEDIPMLIHYHLDKIFNRLKHRVSFSENALAVLTEYSWPGNIRELQNFLERMTILYPDSVINEKMLGPIYLQKKIAAVQPLQITEHDSFNIKEYMSNLERQAIRIALEQTNGKIALAAKLLSMSKATLMNKIKEYNLLPQE
jgi:sigma-54 specific flagellar transcriptional regulator A